MAYSVLMTGKDNERMLYCSVKKSAILKGTEQEMYDFKDLLELTEQAAENKVFFDGLKSKYIKMLRVGGHSYEEANTFLKKEMPFLYGS